jgi:hypothetical protein
MIAPLFRSREGSHYPAFFYRLAMDMFAIVQHWEPPTIPASDRGRLFESVLYRYCRARRLTLTETAGSRTVRRVSSASGFRHESDGVIAAPELTVHLELKHLSEELGKNELLVFNQKGFDYLAADSASFRAKPLYRVIVSGSPLKPEARRFAVQWGILAIEPDRLPLIALHWLAGRRVPHLEHVDDETQKAIWKDVPTLVTSLQDRVARLWGAFGGDAELISTHRVERALQQQREAGDYYWMALEKDNPCWLEEKYDGLHTELGLDDVGKSNVADTDPLPRRATMREASGKSSLLRAGAALTLRAAEKGSRDLPEGEPLPTEEPDALLDFGRF